MKVKSQLIDAQVEARGTNPTKRGEIVIQTADSNQIKYHDGSSVRTVANTDQAQTFTNKSIDADANTLSNISNNQIKSGANIAHNKMAALTASRAMVTDGSGVASASGATATELGYLSGVTSAIQTQVDGKTDKSTLTTKGDIYAATASGTISRLGVGTNNQVLTANSATATGLEWSAVPGGFTVDTRSASFTATVSYVHRIDSSGGAITVTPPAGSNGNQIVLEKTTSDFNAITFTGITAIHTLGERVTLIYNGSAWVVFNRYILSEWTSYTPSFTGFGTVSSSQFYWKRIGDSMVVNGIFTAGSTSATTAGISLPSGTSVSTSFITSTFNAGQYTRSVNSSGANKGYVILEDGQTEINLSARGDNNPFTRAGGDACLDTGNSGGVYTTPFKIQGWNG